MRRHGALRSSHICRCGDGCTRRLLASPCPIPAYSLTGRICRATLRPLPAPLANAPWNAIQTMAATHSLQPIKTSRHKMTDSSRQTSSSSGLASTPVLAALHTSKHNASSTCTTSLCSRVDYVKLAFTGSASVETKLRWPSEVKRTFAVGRDLAETKIAAVTLHFPYISRRLQDIIDWGNERRVSGAEPYRLPRKAQGIPQLSRH